MKFFRWIKKDVMSNFLANLIVYPIILIIGWASHFVPTIIREFSYSGSNISGRWISDFEFEGIKGEEDIRLSQNGHKISGIIHTITHRPDGKERILDSKITGEFRDDYLIAYYVPESDDRFGCGTFTFRLTQGGNLLEGYCPFQYTQTRELKCIEYSWRRYKEID
jgi:hypothetical protein